MSDPQFSEPTLAGASREEIASALFAQMVIQQANLAMMLLGKVPHPQTGETTRDLEAARMFIDQLEMLETKTKGNLSREEEQLLKHSLMSLRLAFVEAVDSPPSTMPPAADSPAPAPATEATESKLAPGAAVAEEESRKKFSKKY